MKILVTGAAGFIGSHLVEALVELHHEVVGLDNLSTGAAANVAVAGESGHFVLHLGSVLDAQLVDELTEAADYVIHLAAAVGVRLIVEQPLRSLITNIRGTETVLEAAHRYRVPVFLASTSEIYGKNENTPFREDSDRVLGAPTLNRWAYSTSKAVDEYLAYAYHAEKALPCVVGRLFNTVGPRQSPAYGMVIPRLVQQALTRRSLTVFGDGQQTRCFCSVDDAVRAILLLMEDERAVGEAFNIGSTEEVSMRELADRIRTTTGTASDIVHISYEDAYGAGFEDMRRRVPDIGKLQGLTGWTPKHDLDAIIAATVTAFSE